MYLNHIVHSLDYTGCHKKIKEIYRQNKISGTKIHWLRNGGAMINSRGTVVMIDPVLSGFDMPLLIEVPLTEAQVPHLDGILLTHCDNDHYSRKTCKELAKVTRDFHATCYVAELLRTKLNISGIGHKIGEQFATGSIEATLTSAWPDGSIWTVGDSRLMEEQLHMPAPDAILFDFSDSKWHIGLEGAVKMAAAYPETPLLLWHWGSVDAPEWKEFNENPEELKCLVVNPDRVVVLNQCH